MKTQSLLIALLFVSFAPSLSQTGNPFLTDDTLTTGNFDDSHPALNRSIYDVRPDWESMACFRTLL